MYMYFCGFTQACHNDGIVCYQFLFNTFTRACCNLSFTENPACLPTLNTLAEPCAIQMLPKQIEYTPSRRDKEKEWMKKEEREKKQKYILSNFLCMRSAKCISTVKIIKHSPPSFSTDNVKHCAIEETHQRCLSPVCVRQRGTMIEPNINLNEKPLFQSFAHKNT